MGAFADKRIQKQKIYIDDSFHFWIETYWEGFSNERFFFKVEEES